MSTAIGVSLPRLATAVGKAVSEYAVLGKTPGFTADFIKNKYPSYSSFASAITHSRSGNAVMTDGYGPELVVNGGFDSDSGWTKGAGWSIYDGKATHASGTSGNLEQSFTPVAGKTYAISFHVSGRTAGTIRPEFRGGSTVVGTSTGDNGQQTQFITAVSGNNNFLISAGSAFDGTIDNVSVREMPVLKWAPHNVSPYSEQFDQWTQDDVTVSANSITAPDGTTTADKIVEDSDNSNHFVSRNVGSVVAGLSYTSSVFAKAGEVSILQASHSFLANTYANFDLSSGTVTAKSSSVTATITDVGDGWYLCEAQSPYTTSGTAVNAWMLQESGTATRGAAYQGDGSSGLYLWGAHFYRSDLGGMVDNPERGDSYVPTTSSAKYLPRIGHHVYNGSAWVNEGLLAESEARTNILPYSQDFTNGEWVKVNTATLALDAVGPDGQEDSACTLVDSNAGGTNAVILREYVNVAASTAYTFSVYVKKSGLSKAMLYHANFTTPVDNGWVFDLENGTFAAYGGTPNSTATIQEVGNGWYRCAITFTTDSTDTAGELRVYPYGSSVTVDLDGTSSILIYGAQFEAASTPSSLIPTSGSSVTRAAETFTIPSANLPWPSPVYIGSELVTNGTFDTDSDWTKASNWSIGSGVATSDGGSGLLQQTTTVLDTSKVYLFEFEITSYTSGSVKIYSGAGGDPTDYVSAVGSYSFAFSPLGTTPSLFSNAFNGSVDSVSVREINPLSVSIAMDGRVTYADEGTTQTSKFYRWRSLSGEYIQPSIYTDSTRTGLMAFEQTVLGVYDAVTSSTTHYSPDVLVPFDVASRHGSTFINGATEGVALTADTTPTALADLSATDLNLAYDYMGTVGTFRVWDRDIGDDGLVEVTAPSFEPTLSLEFTAEADTSFVVYDWSE